MMVLQSWTLEIVVIGIVTGFGSAIGSTVGSFLVQRFFLKHLEAKLLSNKGRKRR